MSHESLYTAYASDIDFDSDPNYNDSDFGFSCSHIVFVEFSPEKVVVVAEPMEASRIVVDIGKVVVGTE